MPNPKYNSSSHGLLSVYVGTGKAGKSPNTARLTTLAVTAAITIAVNAWMPKSPRITSSEKITPAIGALNVAAIPAAAPAANKLIMRRSFILKNCPMLDPSAAPI